jgi:succinate-semialdehyde dehydrogenase/glutarate-semialdehyde dehydrogenase
MITDGARARGAALVDGALSRGARIGAKGSGREDGNFLQPVLVEGVSPHDPLVAGEIFGPVAAVMTFATMDEAIQLANATRSGLAAYAVTQSLDRTLALSERLEAGIIGINSGAVSAAEMPFGGLKESGLGREGAAEGLAAYMETRYWCWEGGATPA